MSTDEASLLTFYRERGGVAECDAIFRIGKIFRCEPPGDGVVFHSLQHKAGSETRGIALHHLEVEAPDRLHLPEREWVRGIGVIEVEIIRAPCLGVTILV